MNTLYKLSTGYCLDLSEILFISGITRWGTGHISEDIWDYAFEITFKSGVKHKTHYSWRAPQDANLELAQLIINWERIKTLAE